MNPSSYVVCNSLAARRAALACIEGAKRPKCALARDMKTGCEKWKALFTRDLADHLTATNI